MLTEFKLGAEAISYLREELSDGDILAKSLLALPLEAGSTAVMLPPDVDPKRLTSFRTGGICKKAEPLDALVTGAIKYLSKPGHPIAVFETLARVGDTGLSSINIPYFIHGKHVFYFAKGPGSNHEKARAVIKNARNYPFIGLLSQRPSTCVDVASGQQVTDEFISDLVNGCEHILVGAFDNEATLVWTRS